MGQRKQQKALIVEVNYTVRVVVEEIIDPNVDPEFNEAVHKKLLSHFKEEGVDYTKEAIYTFRDDKEQPFDPEHDKP